MKFDVNPLSDALGAEIVGIDLRDDLDDDVMSAIQAAWHRYLVLVFRGQDLSEEEQVRFTERFGPLGVPRRPAMPTARSSRERHPAVMLVSNIRENGLPLGFPHDGEMWFHSDMCYTETPHKATMLFALELPSEGGNTMFSNMYSAHDRLPAELRAYLKGRKAVHVREYKRAERPELPKDLKGVRHFAHPVFVTHPATERKALYVNRLMTARIEGVPPRVSEAWLDALFEYAEDPAIIYEHRWRPGDFVMWDNRCTNHARTPFPDHERRLLRRTTVSGKRPV